MLTAHNSQAPSLCSYDPQAFFLTGTQIHGSERGVEDEVVCGHAPLPQPHLHAPRQREGRAVPLGGLQERRPVSAGGQVLAGWRRCQVCCGLAG